MPLVVAVNAVFALQVEPERQQPARGRGGHPQGGPHRAGPLLVLAQGQPRSGPGAGGLAGREGGHGREQGGGIVPVHVERRADRPHLQTGGQRAACGCRGGAGGSCGRAAGPHHQLRVSSCWN